MSVVGLSERAGEETAGAPVPPSCPTCRRVLVQETPGLRGLILGADELAAGSTTDTLARAIGRRTKAVRDELRALEAEGLVQRRPAPVGAAWNRTVWRLAERAGEKPLGRPQDVRTRDEEAPRAQADLPPVPDDRSPLRASAPRSDRVQIVALLLLVSLALALGATTALVLDRGRLSASPGRRVG